MRDPFVLRSISHEMMRDQLISRYLPHQRIRVIAQIRKTNAQNYSSHNSEQNLSPLHSDNKLSETNHYLNPSKTGHLSNQKNTCNQIESPVKSEQNGSPLKSEQKYKQHGSPRKSATRSQPTSLNLIYNTTIMFCLCGSPSQLSVLLTSQTSFVWLF